MVELTRERLVEALGELVRIPSINPDLVPGAGGEAEIAAAIADRLRRTPGIMVELQDAGGGRPNVIASVGDGPGRTLLLNGHTDTVGVAGMAAPFEPRVEGGRLHGRGASDMKDALAAMIVLLEEVARAGDFPGRLVATFVADEEYASIGTQAICREIGRWRPDAALVLEQTDLDVGVAHKGFIWAEIVTHGRAAHGSRFADGVDAVAHMGRVLVALERLGGELVARPPHRRVGPPSIHASLISGGQELSSYPEACHLWVERRTIPGETREQVRGELQGILDRLAAEDPGFRATLEMGLERRPFEVAEDAPIIQAVARAAEAERGVTPRLVGWAGWMDSALLAAAGVPTAIFGSSGDGAHALEEWSDLDTLETFGRVLARVAYDFCAG
ncbi:MAG TPA: M20/M25/M40 family metallo-hydrolase [Thermomicrobiaceae bacterium]|nr:M20/M25/M40 family metallo-hydrolase [Thermomicrobiaceae bacterium]